MHDTILEKDTICAEVGDDHAYNCTVSTIGRTGENGVAQLEITIPEELSGFWAYLDFKKPNGGTFKTPRLEVVNNTIEYDIPAGLLDEGGNIETQLVLQNADGLIWKSTIKKYVVLKSIDATDDIPDKEDFITNAQKLIDSLTLYKVGVSTAQGGEIFNDYSNNQAVSEFATAKGHNTVAGMRGFNIIAPMPDDRGYVLDNSEGLAVGDTVSIIMADVILNYATITEILEGNAINLDIDKVTLNFNSMSKTGCDYNYLFVLDKPTIGTEDLSEYAHAVGYNNKAVGKASHTEGASNIASGWYSHAEGRGNQALDYNAHAEGRQTLAGANSAHAEGRWTKATGIYSHAEGAESEATGSTSHAEGGTTKAVGNWSHSEGHETQALGDCSHAEGDKTEAGKVAHAEGYGTKANGEFSHAEGYETKANGNLSHTEGFQTVASGAQSHVEGYLSYAHAPNAHAEGYGTKVESTAEGAHTEGVITVATGTGGHAEGYFTRANGAYSHSQGYNTQANGEYSHSSGLDTIAEGKASSALGIGTQATAEGQTVVGKYNKPVDGALFIVGNGTSDTDRSNALEVYEDGTVKAGDNGITTETITDTNLNKTVLTLNDRKIVWIECLPINTYYYEDFGSIGFEVIPDIDSSILELLSFDVSAITNALFSNNFVAMFSATVEETNKIKFNAWIKKWDDTQTTVVSPIEALDKVKLCLLV